MAADERIEELLHDISTLLTSCGQANWGSVFNGYHATYPSNPEATARKILSVYGGMGSFNDVVLYTDGQVAVAENNRLDCMRKELYERSADVIHFARSGGSQRPFRQ